MKAVPVGDCRRLSMERFNFRSEFFNTRIPLLTKGLKAAGPGFL
jgi:hypothetical protein